MSESRVFGFDQLQAAEAELPSLLASPAGWRSLDVDYHPPRVERLWRPWGDGLRLFLHCIHPCHPTEALLHPHSWPSVMRVHGPGAYHMLVGSELGQAPPPVVLETRVQLGVGGSFTYAMLHPDGWHAVIPHGQPVYTVMLTGEPWRRPIPAITLEAGSQLSHLSLVHQAELLEYFRGLYPA